MRRLYRNYPNVTVLMYRHLPVESAGKIDLAQMLVKQLSAKCRQTQRSAGCRRAVLLAERASVPTRISVDLSNRARSTLSKIIPISLSACSSIHQYRSRGI